MPRSVRSCSRRRKRVAGLGPAANVETQPTDLGWVIATTVLTGDAVGARCRFLFLATTLRCDFIWNLRGPYLFLKVSAAANGSNEMLGWALTFLVIALVAGALGLSGVAAISLDVAQLLFWVFIILFVVFMIARAVQGRRPPVA